jgi:glycine/D-amino acid oxidase-like deaminating enzyme
MAERAQIVIVGGGIMGLAIAYNLAKNHGITNVVVLEKSYLCGGASGRNGGGVRAQFSSEENIRLMQESIRICRTSRRDEDQRVVPPGRLPVPRRAARPGGADPREERRACRTTAGSRPRC